MKKNGQVAAMLKKTLTVRMTGNSFDPGAIETGNFWILPCFPKFGKGLIYRAFHKARSHCTLHTTQCIQANTHCTLYMFY